jgi:hypothetical protein
MVWYCFWAHGEDTLHGGSKNVAEEAAYLMEARRQREVGGTTDKIYPKGTLPVTYFLQIGPTS